MTAAAGFARQRAILGILGATDLQIVAFAVKDGIRWHHIPGNLPGMLRRLHEDGLTMADLADEIEGDTAGWDSRP